MCSLTAGRGLGRSEIFLDQLPGYILRLTNSESNDREGWICRRAATELAAVRDKQVADVVRLAPFIANTVVRPFTLSARAEIVSGWAWRNSNDSRGTDRLKELRTLHEPVFPHFDVVGMIIEMDVRNRHAELVFLVWMKRHAVAFLRHVFPTEPYASGIWVRFNHSRIVAPPISDVRTHGKT